MSLADYIPLLLAFAATIAGLFSNPRESKFGLWAAVLVATIALGTLVASTIALRSALKREDELQNTLSRLEGQSEERGDQLRDARESLSMVESELASVPHLTEDSLSRPDVSVSGHET
jgi:hypothetical protein